MNCVMDIGSTCSGLRRKYCRGTSEGMAICPFYKTKAKAESDNRNSQNRLEKIGLSSKKTLQRGRPVICIETGERFMSVTEAGIAKNITHGNITSQIGGKLKTAGGYRWRYEDV